MLASEHGHTEIVDILIQAGANVNFTDKRNFNALGCAISNCKVEVVKLLLEKGAQPDSSYTDKESALQFIAKKEIQTAEDLIIAKLLLEKGADLEKIDKQSKLYPLLKIIGNLADDEIKVVANHLEDFKVISNGILMYKSFSEKESGPIQELTNDTMSKILIESFPTNLREVFEKDLISKLVNNLLEIYSREEREKREANSLLLAPTLSPPTPPVQDEQPSGSPGCFSCIRIVVAKMLGSNSGIDRQ
jgi:hypothetical protein